MRLEYVHKLLDENEVPIFGEYVPETGTIRINRTLLWQHPDVTHIHELFHALTDYLDDSRISKIKKQFLIEDMLESTLRSEFKVIITLASALLVVLLYTWPLDLFSYALCG